MSSPDRKAPEFFLIRHGETDWNRDGRLQGQRDIPLNAVGRDQADGAGRALGALLRTRGYDPGRVRFIASPLGRARDTMERVRDALGLPRHDYRIDQRLREISFGAWEGFTWRELKSREPKLVKARKQDRWSFSAPNGESYADLATRVRCWLETVEPGDVAVAHGGVARALMQLRGLVAAGAAPEVDIVQGRVLWFHARGCDWV